MRQVLEVVSVFLLSALAPAAHADGISDFSGTVLVNGTLFEGNPDDSTTYKYTYFVDVPAYATLTLNSDRIPGVTAYVDEVHVDLPLDPYTYNGFEDLWIGHGYCDYFNPNSCVSVDEVGEDPSGLVSYDLFLGGRQYSDVFSSPEHEETLDLTYQGRLSPTAITPEPSTFAFLGTGLWGVAGMIKRRST